MLLARRRLNAQQETFSVPLNYQARREVMDSLSEINKMPVDHCFDNIVEITLTEFNINHSDILAWDLLSSLYKEVLHDDPLWHFFYEDSDTIIRFSNPFEDDVLLFLINNEIDYTEPALWKDNQKYTAKYQRIFTILFHGFSELAMETPPEDMPSVTERIIHCHLDMQWYKLSDYRRRHGEVFWEGAILARNALARVAYQSKRDNVVQGQINASKIDFFLDEL